MQHRVFDNEEIKNIYTALGVSLGTEEDGRALNLTRLRYHKVVIMCDADVDGSHIETLILTFFFRHMKELIEKGFVYIATPTLLGQEGFPAGVLLERCGAGCGHRTVPYSQRG